MIILGTNSIKDTGYNVDNSCRFNDGSSDYMHKTPSSAGNLRTWTWSGWVKRSDLSSGTMFSAQSSTTANLFYFYFGSNHTLNFYHYSSSGGVTDSFLGTNQVFRDTSAWYHIVLAVDTTQGTASNRVKIYVNGQITSLSTALYFNQNYDTYVNATNQHRIGSNPNNTEFFDGYLAETVLIDGQQLDATSFGEFDSDSSIWKPIDVSGLTFGTNGFHLDYQDSANLGNDANGGTDLTEVNLTAIDQSTDTCTNNFATMSTPTWYNGTIANGGLTVSTNQTNYRYQPSSIGVSSGKWYWEIKFTTASHYALMGITDQPHYTTGSTNILGSGAYDYALYYGNGSSGGGDGHLYNNAGASPGNTPGAFMGAFSQGDIIMFALDCDNNTLKIGANNSWANGSGSTNQTFSNTTAKAITAVGSTSTGYYFPAVGDYGGGTSVFDLNFGSPSFAISSGNTDGDGYGNFEYAVPSGYYALNTKNLAEYG